MRKGGRERRVTIINGRRAEMRKARRVAGRRRRCIREVREGAGTRRDDADVAVGSWKSDRQGRNRRESSQQESERTGERQRERERSGDDGVVGSGSWEPGGRARNETERAVAAAAGQEEGPP